MRGHVGICHLVDKRLITQLAIFPVNEAKSSGMTAILLMLHEELQVCVYLYSSSC